MHSEALKYWLGGSFRSIDADALMKWAPSQHLDQSAGTLGHALVDAIGPEVVHLHDRDLGSDPLSLNKYCRYWTILKFCRMLSKNMAGQSTSFAETTFGEQGVVQGHSQLPIM